MKEPVPAVSARRVRDNKSARAGLRLASAPSRSSQSAQDDGPHGQCLARLARLLKHHAPYDGAFALPLPGLHAVRLSKATREMVRATVTPALCIVAQGAKVVMLGREVYSYDASRMIAYSVDLPLAGQVVQASQSEPFLALKLDLDPYKIAELALRVYPHGVPSPQDRRGIFVGQATTAIVDAAGRLVVIARPLDHGLRKGERVAGGAARERSRSVKPV